MIAHNGPRIVLVAASHDVVVVYAANTLDATSDRNMTIPAEALMNALAITAPRLLTRAIDPAPLFEDLPVRSVSLFTPARRPARDRKASRRGGAFLSRGSFRGRS